MENYKTPKDILRGKLEELQEMEQDCISLIEDLETDITNFTETINVKRDELSKNRVRQAEFRNALKNLEAL